MIPKSAQVVYVGKRAGAHALPQDQINRLLIDEAKNGKRVVRLKGGDPFVFGRGGEEAEELVAAGVPFEIVPGISSAIAGPGYAGIPVTHRAYATSVTLVTAHEADSGSTGIQWEALAQLDGTIVFMMGFANLGAIVRNLTANGMASARGCAVISKATRADQRTIAGTLADIESRVAAAAGHFVGGADDECGTANRVHAGVPLQKIPLPAETLRMHQVVSVHARQVASLSQARYLIQPVRQPAVAAVADHDNPRVADLPRDRQRAVCRPIVYEQELPVRVGLREDRLQCRGQRLCAVIEGQADGDGLVPRHGQPSRTTSGLELADRGTPDRLDGEGLKDSTRMRPSSATHTRAITPNVRSRDAES